MTTRKKKRNFGCPRISLEWLHTTLLVPSYFLNLSDFPVHTGRVCYACLPDQTFIAYLTCFFFLQKEEHPNLFDTSRGEGEKKKAKLTVLNASLSR